MEPLESSAGVTTHRGEKDKVFPNDRLTRLRIDARNRVELPGGHRVRELGESVVCVREQDVDAIMGMVEEEPELIEAAKEAFEKQIDREVADADPRSEWTTNAVRAARKAPEPTEAQQEMVDARAAAYETTAFSVEAAFHKENDRDYLPLVSVEVLEEGLLYAEQDKEMQRTAEANTALANAIAQGMSSTKPKGASKKGE